MAQKQIKIKNIKSTIGILKTHNLQADVPYNVCSRSESGIFYYIPNPMHNPTATIKNAAWVAVSKDECEEVK